jgi:hypothetical protein
MNLLEAKMLLGHAAFSPVIVLAVTLALALPANDQFQSSAGMYFQCAWAA